jgi:hypothetical protein
MSAPSTRIYVATIDPSPTGPGVVVTSDSGATYAVPTTARATADGAPAAVDSLPGWFTGVADGMSVSAEIHFGGGVTEIKLWAFGGGG